jgi:hypothetical protein
MTTPHDPGPWLDRRLLLQRAAVLGLLLTPAGALAAGCGQGDGGMPMMGGNSSSMPAWMMSDGMMDPAMMADMPVIMDLLNSHQAIQRSVDDVDGGIVSRTTSTDPRIAGLIGTHVAAMKARIEQNRPIRHGDPLFREIFNYHADVTIAVEQLPDGVQVTETSADRQVTLLIRQHARAAVSQFVASGMARAMQPTPLPAGYHT